MRRARAHRAARWALTHTPSRVLADHWAVHDSRARHMRLAGTECVTDTYELVRDPGVDGSAIVAGGMEALVDRFLDETRADRRALEAKLDHLVHDVEHRAEAAQNRALQVGEDVDNALMTHAKVLVEIVAIRRALGLEEE